MTCQCGDHTDDTEHLQEEFHSIRLHLACYKIAYYRPELLPESIVNLLTVRDDHYDSMEMRYLQLCVVLGHPNTLSHQPHAGIPAAINGTGMMEVDESSQEIIAAIAWALDTFKNRLPKRKKRKARKP